MRGMTCSKEVRHFVFDLLWKAGLRCIHKKTKQKRNVQNVPYYVWCHFVVTVQFIREQH